MKTYKIILSGRVQGVFFRLFTKKKANELGIKGYVKNLENDKIEAVFQGKEDSIKKIINWCKKGPSSARIDSIKIHQIKSEKEYKEFKVEF